MREKENYKCEWLRTARNLYGSTYVSVRMNARADILFSFLDKMNENTLAF